MKYTSKNPNGINQIASSSVAISVLNTDVAVFTTSSFILGGALTSSNALITGNVVVLGTASINTLVVNQTKYSSGSNQLGDGIEDTQTLFGTVRIPTGSLTVTGSSIMSGSLNVTGSVNILTGGGYLSLKALGGGSTQIEGSSTLGLNPIGALDFYRNGVLHSRIANSTSNWLIGTTTDSGFKLDVSGSGRFSGNLTITGSATNSLLVRGSGTTFSTSALLVQNANASTLFTIRDDGNIQLGISQFLGTLLLGGDSNIRSSANALSLQAPNGVKISSTNSWAVSSAQLEVTSTTKGLLPPRTNLTSNISNPAQGLITYLTGSTNEGLYYYNSGSYQGWTKVLNSSGSQSISGDLIVTGSLLIGENSPSLYTSRTTIINSGSTDLYSIPTSSYDAVYFDYVIKSGSNARAGQVFSTYITTASTYIDNSTSDIGNTSVFYFSSSISSSNLVLHGSTTSDGWKVKTIIRGL
jgi:hypothetical protein